MPARERAWWLEAGSEICPFCEVRYQAEAASYCSACDRPICQTCFFEVLATRRVLCPECHVSPENY